MHLQHSFSFSYRWSYDVFLSFRGTDTRHGFAGNLFSALRDKGIRTFFDDEELRRGDEIKPSLVKAIQESRVAIPIFSPNYAASSFCLDELATIMDCVKVKGRLVLPVFYGVDPSHVRHQTETYAEAFAKHEERFKDDGKERVHKWREALHQAANLSGYHFKLGDEYEYVFVERTVKCVSDIVCVLPLHVANHPVGLESRVLQVKRLLNDRSDGGVHMVGIYGIGGIGKSTLARAVYSSIAGQFDGVCFLENVRENSMKHGLPHLQEMLLSKIVGLNIKLGSVNEGIPLIKHRLHGKKILLVLDDVDKLEQLQAIVGGNDWFGFGSRVIITTRDSRLLVSHGIQRKYDVEGLNEKEALQLLTWNAFKEGEVDPSYTDVINLAVTYACGLPLALEVIGSNLVGKSVEEWRSTLGQYERIPNKEIQKILKVSFDALEECQQKIFLDIACHFNGCSLEWVEDTLCVRHDVYLKCGISILVDKSLVKIDKHNCVTLHDLVQDMGREIVRQESPEMPGKRSRLWLYEDIVQVLEDNTGTSAIEIIVLDALIHEEVAWDRKAFKKMKNLEILIIRGARLFSQGPKHLPNSLRMLEWTDYPSNYLPSDFYPKKLAIFVLCDSNLMSMEFMEKQKFMNLTVLKLDSSTIEQIPDVSGAPNLEELSFSLCKHLVKVHESVGFLDKLWYLDASYCTKLRSFPPLMLPFLRELYLSDCFRLETFPEILGEMKYIEEIVLLGTYIKELPSSIANLTDLNTLVVRTRGVFQLPRSICMMPRLRQAEFSDFEGLRFPKQDEGEEQGSSVISSVVHVTFRGCHMSDESVPIVFAWFRNVEELDLTGNDFTVVPESIEELLSLKKLTLDDCKKLREIESLPPSIERFSLNNCTSLTSSSRSMLLDEELHRGGDDMMFDLPGSNIPEWFDHIISGNDSICFWYRNKLPAISLCVVYQDFDDCDNCLLGDHISISAQSNVKVDQLFSKNGWNLVMCRRTHVNENARISKIGIYVHKNKSSMEDIRFPDLLKEEVMMQQQNNLAPLAFMEIGEGEWLSLRLPLSVNSMNDDLNWDSNSITSMPISSCTNVQDGIVLQLPRCIFMMPNVGFCGLDGLRFPRLDEGEEQGSSVISSVAHNVTFRRCHMSDESFPIVFAWFRNVKCLNLTGNDFTVVPESIIELLSLKELTLDNCEKLQEIGGIPPNIKHFSLENCTSLTSSCRSMLLNKELRKGRNIYSLYLPGSSIPEWFDHIISGDDAIHFWYRKKLPAISLCVLYRDFANRLHGDHISITDQTKVNYLFSKCGWHLVVCRKKHGSEDALIHKIGIYVHKHRSSMEDIRFTDPLKEGVMMQQLEYLTSFALLEMGQEKWLSSINSLNDDSNWDSNSVTSMPISSFANVQDQAPAESSHAPPCAEMPNIQAAPTEDSLTNQIDMSQVDDEDAEMEEFYASLDAGAYVLTRPHDKLATNVPSEGAKEALKILKVFITNNDASILLDPEHCSVVKTSLDYLSKLTADDSLSGGMRALISEASRVFTHCSREYIEASMKIQSTASELLRADELEADLEDNKKRFKEVVALEKELLQKLANDQIKANNISASQSEQNMTRKRKRDIFEEGKMLRSQMDEFMEKVPGLQREQDLAKERQAKIKVEWSELGEKFKTVVE